MNHIDEMRVSNVMNASNLEHICIMGLFGRYDIEIPFTKEVNIFIGENGLGKTTILNCIYYVLDKKIIKLESQNFNEIRIKFKDDSLVYRITPSDIAKYNQRRRGRGNTYFNEDYVEHFLEKYFYEYNIMVEDSIGKSDIDFVTRRLAQQTDMPISVARRMVIQFIETKHVTNNDIRGGDASKVESLLKALAKNVPQRIIYLPTYRRIEDDFSNLDLRIEDLNKELLIRFGMSDVKTSIERILDKIRSEAVKGFTEMTGVLLRQYADGQDLFSESNVYPYVVDYNTVKIVLDRIGNEIESDYKTKILNLIANDEIYNFQYLYLLNLIRKIISSYDLQKSYDDRIKKFTDTCNKYLIDKHFTYNQSTLSVEINLDSDLIEGKTIELTQLSSGEKQIVSLFSRLYLESDEKCIVIIDEPELSLSLKWQQMLLPDIMRTDNCDLLITVTHSPFIFENEFDLDAKEMKRYIRIHK